MARLICIVGGLGVYVAGVLLAGYGHLYIGCALAGAGGLVTGVSATWPGRG